MLSRLLTLTLAVCFGSACRVPDAFRGDCYVLGGCGEAVNYLCDPTDFTMIQCAVGCSGDLSALSQATCMTPGAVYDTFGASCTPVSSPSSSTPRRSATPVVTSPNIPPVETPADPTRSPLPPTLPTLVASAHFDSEQVTQGHVLMITSAAVLVILIAVVAVLAAVVPVPKTQPTDVEAFRTTPLAPALNDPLLEAVYDPHSGREADYSPDHIPPPWA